MQKYQFYQKLWPLSYVKKLKRQTLRVIFELYRQTFDNVTNKNKRSRKIKGTVDLEDKFIADSKNPAVTSINRTDPKSSASIKGYVSEIATKSKYTLNYAPFIFIG